MRMCRLKTRWRPIIPTKRRLPTTFDDDDHDHDHNLNDFNDNCIARITGLSKFRIGLLIESSATSFTERFFPTAFQATIILDLTFFTITDMCSRFFIEALLSVLHVVWPVPKRRKTDRRICSLLTVACRKWYAIASSPLFQLYRTVTDTLILSMICRLKVRVRW